MGTWGPGINSNDIASDVVDDCKLIYPVLTPEESNDKILDIYSEILTDETDYEFAAFWYALVNWQWDHGVLPEANKALAVDLLQRERGMEPWLEEGNKGDIKKRSLVLKQLYEKLLYKQPETKCPVLKLKKPKHKIGDIIIFKTLERASSDEDFLWNVKSLSSPKYFENISTPLPDSLSTVFNAQGKYLAILCVGKEKEAYSQYFPDLYHENSVYAFYDYCNDKKPSVADLSECGFLPDIDINYSDFNRGIVESLDWTYTFETIDPFRPKSSYVEAFEKTHSQTETDRFDKLLRSKNYKGQSLGLFRLMEAFETFFEEKLRFASVGIEIDNLTSANITNPQLITAEKYNKKMALDDE